MDSPEEVKNKLLEYLNDPDVLIVEFTIDMSECKGSRFAFTMTTVNIADEKAESDTRIMNLLSKAVEEHRKTPCKLG